MATQYAFTATMKENRLIVLKECGYKCQMCGGEAQQIHHLDLSKNNHETSNLLPLCTSCHAKLHKWIRAASVKFTTKSKPERGLISRLDFPKKHNKAEDSDLSRGGELVVLLRRNLGLSQIELVEKVGVSQSYLSAIENGTKRNPSVDVLEKLGKVLGFTIGEFFEGKRL